MIRKCLTCGIVSKVSTYFSTVMASANALTVSLSSCVDGSRQYGIVIEGPSLGSNIAGWVDTAAVKGESANAASVITWSCNLSVMLRSHAHSFILFHPSKVPLLPIW